MTRVVSGPARCIECRAVWRVVHVTLTEEGCVRCGGSLEPLADGLELLPLQGRERRYSIPSPASMPALDAAR